MLSAKSIVLVKRCGTLSTVNAVYSTSTLFKKCGYKTSADFEQQAEWAMSDAIKADDLCNGISYVGLFGKCTGGANRENKYEFPPPADNTLFFGTCALVAFTETGDATALTLPAWNKIYEDLMGGFEDLDDTRDTDECERIIDDVVSDGDEPDLTKTGYEKDGFVVEDDDIGSENVDLHLPDNDSDYVTESSDSDTDSQLSEDSYESESDTDDDDDAMSV